jgi:hypothetical protein
MSRAKALCLLLGEPAERIRRADRRCVSPLDIPVNNANNVRAPAGKTVAQGSSSPASEAAHGPGTGGPRHLEVMTADGMGGTRAHPLDHKQQYWV